MTMNGVTGKESILYTCIWILTNLFCMCQCKVLGVYDWYAFAFVFQQPSFGPHRAHGIGGSISIDQLPSFTTIFSRCCLLWVWLKSSYTKLISVFLFFLIKVGGFGHGMVLLAWNNGNLICMSSDYLAVHLSLRYNIIPLPWGAFTSTNTILNIKLNLFFLDNHGELDIGCYFYFRTIRYCLSSWSSLNLTTKWLAKNKKKTKEPIYQWATRSFLGNRPPARVTVTPFLWPSVAKP